MKQKKTAKIILLIAMYIALAIIAVILFKRAWAMFAQTVSGSATASVARWHFNLVDGDNLSENGSNFPITRTDSNTSVVPTKLAPGTYGTFEIEVDTSRN